MLDRIKQLVKDKSDPELHISQRIGAQRELIRCGSEYAEYLVDEVEHMSEIKAKHKLLESVCADLEQLCDQYKQDRDSHQRVCMREIERTNILKKALDRIHTETTDAWACGYALRILQSSDLV